MWPSRAQASLLVSSLGLAFAGLVGCSGDDGGSGGGTWGGTGAKEWWCHCVSGVSITVEAPHDGTAPQDACNQMCQDEGGVESMTPRESAEGTAECDAFCAKIAALPCETSCDADFWCGVGAHSCLEARRAELQCKADTGTFECTENGWSSSSGCGSYDELCP